MMERDAFVYAVCREPADDTPRLVFADWLQENGDASDRDRAEFIRLQIQIARMKPMEMMCDRTGTVLSHAGGSVPFVSRCRAVRVRSLAASTW